MILNTIRFALARHLLGGMVVLPASEHAKLVEVYNATRSPDLRPGDICTWGGGAIACKVITNDQNGFCVEWLNGGRDVFPKLNRPSGLVKLPDGTPLGPIDRAAAA